MILTTVLQDITIEANWVKATCNHSIISHNACESTVILIQSLIFLITDFKNLDGKIQNNVKSVELMLNFNTLNM